jgi:hypothetical protein
VRGRSAKRAFRPAWQLVATRDRLTNRAEARERAVYDISPHLSDGRRQQSDARNTGYQGQTVIGKCFDRLAGGWTPTADPLPAVRILDAQPSQTVPMQAKRGFLARLVGR